MKKKLLVIFLIGIACVSSEAQSFYNFGKQRTLMVSGGIGNATYFGDLKDPKDYFDAKLNITGGLQYFFNPRMSVRGELTWFQLAGDDKDADDVRRNIRNLSFRSSNFELSFTGTINLLEIPPRFNQRPVVNPYLFGGFGLLYTNPKAELDGTRYALKPLETESNSYSRINLVIPFGFGVRLKVSDLFNVAIEGGYRKTFTDYLDDVSTRHPDKSTWDPTSVRYRLSDRTPELGLSPNETGAKRGDPSKDDGYFLLNVKVEYYLANNFLFGSSGNQRKLYNRKRKAIYNRRR